MGNTWYPYNRRLRSRLRKRKNSPYYLGFYRFSKYGCYDKDRLLESGFTVGETWGCLEKAWVGFRAAKRLENFADMKLYASVIQRLERELNIEVNEFPDLGLCVCDPLNEGNAEEDQTEEDDSKLAVIDFWTNEKIQEAKEDDYLEVDPETNRVNKPQDEEDDFYYM
jgi:hypothetical protein